jgi:hypothetical protein
MLSNQRLISSLSFFGLLPFFGAAFLMMAGILPLMMDPKKIFVGYSVIILAFLSGSLWGQVLDQADSIPSRVILVASNLIALLGWASLGLSNYSLVIATLSLGYILILSLEYSFASLLFDDVSHTYFKLRCKLTTIVLLTHVLMVAFNI